MSNTITITLERQFDSMGCHPDYKYLKEDNVEIEIDLSPIRSWSGDECFALRRVGEDESIYVPVKMLKMLLGLIEGT